MLKQQLQKPEIFLYLVAAAVPIGFAAWQALINNFAIEKAAFSGIEIGILQSLREVPGFLAFAVVFLLLWMREQTIAFGALFALASLLLSQLVPGAPEQGAETVFSHG